jgi:AMP phosphorylase
MALYLRAKKLDLGAGDELNILLHDDDAKEVGINEGDIVSFLWKDAEINVEATFTTTELDRGEVGLYEEIWHRWKVANGDVVMVNILDRSDAIEHIKKKILGKKLQEEELMLIMKHMGQRRLTDSEVAFFMATFFNPGFDDDEILWMTKGMGHSGHVLSFNNIRDNGSLVVDKHSIGGVAGKGVTPTLVPIIAATGLVIPNTSTRAITSPAGTSDILEVVMPVSLDENQILDTVKRSGACLVWGGALDLAPADDVLIQAEKGIHMESFQKVLVSIVAKKIAMGVSHIVIDLPHGKGTKVQNPEDVEMLDREFRKLFEKVGIKCEVYTRVAKGPDGKSIGPNIEMAESLRILEQHSDRSKQLEELVIDMAGRLLELSGSAKKDYGADLARDTLQSGKALEKFWEIAKAQGAEEVVKSDDIAVGKEKLTFKSKRSGEVKLVNNRELVKVARALGNPIIKEAGLYVHKTFGEEVKEGDDILTIYATTPHRLKTGERAVDLEAMFEVG